jgi:hypothetical protein
MQFGDSSEVDRKCEIDLLAFAQSKSGSTDEHSGRTQIHGFAQPTLSIGQQNVNGRARAVPGVQSSFHPLPLCLEVGAASLQTASPDHYANTPAVAKRQST